MRPVSRLGRDRPEAPDHRAVIAPRSAKEEVEEIDAATDQGVSDRQLNTK